MPWVGQPNSEPTLHHCGLNLPQRVGNWVLSLLKNDVLASNLSSGGKTKLSNHASIITNIGCVRINNLFVHRWINLKVR